MSRKSYKGNVLLEVKSYFAQSCMSQEFFCGIINGDFYFSRNGILSK